jgi:hypothetical protein
MGWVTGTLVWTTMLNYYFISDDFPHLHTARVGGLSELWQLLRYGQAGAFLRPLGFASIFADYAVWGPWPVGFHLTNLALHLTSAGAVYALVRQLGGNVHQAAATSSIFVAMPIQVETVAWMGARFDLLALCLGAWSVVLYVWSGKRSSRIGYAAALALYVLAMLSKEAAFTFPIILFAVDLCVLRVWRPLRLLGAVAAGAIVFGYRFLILGGLAGYINQGTPEAAQVSWKIFPTLLIRAPAQTWIGLNWTQPPQLEALVLASILIGFVVVLIHQARLRSPALRLTAFGAIWMITTLLPGHFLAAISPSLTNSRVLYLPSVGMAIMLGQFLWGISVRSLRMMFFGGVIALYGVGVLHNLAAWRWTANLSRDTLETIKRLAPSPPPNAHFVFSDLPDTERGVFFLRVGLSESLGLVYGRDDLTAIRDTEIAPGSAPPENTIRMKWSRETQTMALVSGDP